MSVAVVTGAAKGIGLAIAERLLEDGEIVIGVDRDAEALHAGARRLGPGFEPLVGDVGNWDDHERAADAAERRGELHSWVNNAGIEWVGGAHEVTPQHISDGLRVLLNGALYGGAVAVRRMLPGRSGAIVNISSIQGVASYPAHYVYGTAKAGLLMSTRSIAVDYATYGIRCNAVLPGTIETPMTYETLDPSVSREEGLQFEAGQAPILRVGQPREIADAVAFLLSDQASFITGALLTIDGGATSRTYAFPPLGLRGA
jgi:NAD(P)-dependent dehydrogenase (short-subunit alcohol dehydrogenase family)